MCRIEVWTQRTMPKSVLINKLWQRYNNFVLVNSNVFNDTDMIGKNAK